MPPENNDLFAFLASVVLIMVLFCATMSMLVGVPVLTIDYLSCTSKAEGLHLEHSWGPLQGCLVTRQDGVVVPIENYGRSDRD